MSNQTRIFKVSKREATREWQRAKAVVRELEQIEAKEKAALSATREALTTARKRKGEAEEVLGEMLDAEDPTLPGGGLDADPTVPQQ